jgi:hypothetical protein
LRRAKSTQSNQTANSNVKRPEIKLRRVGSQRVGFESFNTAKEVQKSKKEERRSPSKIKHFRILDVIAANEKSRDRLEPLSATVRIHISNIKFEIVLKHFLSRCWVQLLVNGARLDNASVDWLCWYLLSLQTTRRDEPRPIEGECRCGYRGSGKGRKKR